MKHQFISKIERLDKLKLNHVIVTKPILEMFYNKDVDSSIYNQRFHITVNDSITWRGGSVVLGNSKGYITFSNKRMKEIGVILGDKVTVTLEKDTSEYGFDVPKEWQAALEQDPLAKQRFEALTMGNRRAIIYLIIQFKTVDKRIEKSLFFLENLKRSPQGKTTMRHILGKDF